MAGVAWIATIVANAVSWHDRGDGIPPQFNAFGFALAGALTIASVVLYAARRLRQGQIEVCASVGVMADMSEHMEQTCAAMLAAVEAHSTTVGDNSRAVTEISRSYADLLRDLHDGNDPRTLRRAHGARQGYLN